MLEGNKKSSKYSNAQGKTDSWNWNYMNSVGRGSSPGAGGKLQSRALTGTGPYTNYDQFNPDNVQDFQFDAQKVANNKNKTEQGYLKRPQTTHHNVNSKNNFRLVSGKVFFFLLKQN